MMSLAASTLRSASQLLTRRAPTVTASIETSLAASFHTTVTLERARHVTRNRKRKIVLANIKKKAERLRKNPKPMAAKVELMLKSKGLWGPPKPIRWSCHPPKPYLYECFFKSLSFYFLKIQKHTNNDLFYQSCTTHSIIYLKNRKRRGI
jgi:hypothetical protein